MVTSETPQATDEKTERLPAEATEKLLKAIFGGGGAVPGSGAGMETRLSALDARLGQVETRLAVVETKPGRSKQVSRGPNPRFTGSRKMREPTFASSSEP